MLGDRPILCAVLDAEALGREPAALAEMVFRAGVDWIQLRERALEDAELFTLTESLVRARDRANAVAPGRRVIVNKRVDIAHATGADGAHLGYDALPAKTAREFLGKTALLGASLHAVDEVEAAARAQSPTRTNDPAPLDYVHLAPIWDPRSKPASRPPLGLEILAEACRAGLPLLAQGGLDAERAAQAIQAGAAGVAVTGILTQGGAPEGQIVSLRQALDLAGRNAHV